MSWWQAVLLGLVEGVTEFLPVSSTGHLTIVEQLLGQPVDDPGVTAFTAIVQLGAIAAVLLYFRTDIVVLARAWVGGIVDRDGRSRDDYRLAWCVVVGSVPIGLVGFAARDVVAGPLRSLWVVVAGLVVWSVVMVAAERWSAARQELSGTPTLRHAFTIGLVQCLALVPGVSRSGATISAGLFGGLDRVTATRISFFLSIPALVAAGAYEGVAAGAEVSASVGWGPTLVSTAVSFVVAYACIAWLLHLVAHHPITVFVGYRLGLAALLVLGLTSGVLSAT